MPKLCGMEPTKTCSQCHKELPHSAFGELSKTTDGLTYKCKECRNADYAKTREGITPKRPAITEDMKPRLLELRSQNLSIDKIQELMGISRTTLYRFFASEGVGDIKTKITEEVEEQILELIGQGIQPKDIAEKIGVVVQTIQALLKENNVEKKGGAYYFSTTVITPEKEAQILELRNKGEGTRSIAKIVGVDRSTVQNFYKRIGIQGTNPPLQPQEVITEKTCKTCSLTKPITEFRARTKNERIYYEPYCLDCERIQRNEGAKRLAKERRKTDPYFRLKRSAAYSIWKMLKKHGKSKNGERSAARLPFTKEQFYAHFEKLFEPKMTWNNQGNYDPETYDTNPTWQIDHIIPQSDLPYTSMDDENFKKCWSLENLRPMWSKQNVLDGVRRTRHKKKTEE